MKIDSVIAKIHAGWKLVVKTVKDADGNDYESAVIVSPFTVPDSEDKAYHKPVLEGGGPANAKQTPLTLAVPSQHIAALKTLSEGKDKPAPAPPPSSKTEAPKAA
jgi:hypothetical protein